MHIPSVDKEKKRQGMMIMVMQAARNDEHGARETVEVRFKSGTGIAGQGLMRTSVFLVRRTR